MFKICYLYPNEVQLQVWLNIIHMWLKHKKVRNPNVPITLTHLLCILHNDLLALDSPIPRILENKSQTNEHPLTLLYFQKNVLNLTSLMHLKAHKQYSSLLNTVCC